MALKFDDACSMTVEEVRSDKSELNWVALKYEGKSKIMVGGKGSGGYVRPCARPSCSVECPRDLTLTPCPRARRRMAYLRYRGGAGGGGAPAARHRRRSPRREPAYGPRQRGGGCSRARVCMRAVLRPFMVTVMRG